MTVALNAFDNHVCGDYDHDSDLSVMHYDDDVWYMHWCLLLRTYEDDVNDDDLFGLFDDDYVVLHDDDYAFHKSRSPTICCDQTNTYSDDERPRVNSLILEVFFRFSWI